MVLNTGAFSSFATTGLQEVTTFSGINEMPYQLQPGGTSTPGQTLMQSNTGGSGWDIAIMTPTVSLSDFMIFGSRTQWHHTQSDNFSVAIQGDSMVAKIMTSNNTTFDFNNIHFRTNGIGTFRIHALD